MVPRICYPSLVLFLYISLAAAVGGIHPSLDPTKSNAPSLPPCKSCSVLVESFYKGIKRTERGKHGGGDAAWEEDRLGSYKTSEVRLVEIQEHLCSELTRNEGQCHQLANEIESELEEWWFKRQQTHPDLHQYLCVETTKVCCPDGHFGPQCLPCTNCGGNGKCKGNGTRKGNGKCSCDKGYEGEHCQKCSVTFYEAFRDDDKLLCSECYKACGDAGCLGAGSHNCLNCRPGWRLANENPNYGCQDIDECVEEGACQRNQFCVNNEGSYSCLDCDKSCDGCNGDGPDLCVKCADGFALKDGLCTDTSSEQRSDYVTMTRYLTYLGLCIATCVIFQSSTWMAALVGIAVAVYISVSEFWLSATTAANGGVGGPFGPTVPDQLAAQVREKLGF